ncbi:hypothetical protein RhiJN_06772 [Ceratobasidium sp. AG-Ba]|nr:hypothetical protein RhiJN_06772 [Ceratobasidium sp. AG-Ba]
MPGVNSTDQQAARAIETALRDAVYRLDRPPVELEWFMALPKRVRRSAQLIETAQIESRVLLEHVRAEWNRSRKLEQEREAQLAKARAQPRDLECLRAPDSAAWHGLGRRKRRCWTFEMTGRAYTTRQQQSNTTSVPQPTTSDTFLLHPSSCYVPKRPPTPIGLREAVRNVPGLIYKANGPARAEDYGCPTPCTPAPIVSISQPTSISSCPPPVHPGKYQPGEWIVSGLDINPDFAYLIALGHHARAPGDDYFLGRAAQGIVDVEAIAPGLLGYLAEGLFPGGLREGGEMTEPLFPILDFCRGWFIFACKSGLTPC